LDRVRQLLGADGERLGGGGVLPRQAGALTYSAARSDSPGSFH
jgi:hypothetical protein